MGNEVTFYRAVEFCPKHQLKELVMDTDNNSDRARFAGKRSKEALENCLAVNLYSIFRLRQESSVTAVECSRCWACREGLK